MPGYDIIGDVHGSAEKLHGLLDLLGWEVSGDSAHSHADPDRQVIFVGDLIDRGKEQLNVLETVRSMVDAGVAQIVMGNHEFNAISYATPHPLRPGEFLRAHSEKNKRQSAEFRSQLEDHDLRSEWIDWFRTFPLWLDLDGLRIAHACWHQESIDVLASEFGGATFPTGDDGFVAANTKGHPVWAAIEAVLKGPEIKLAPYGLPSYRDKGGDVRDAARVRWWFPGARTIRDLIDLPSDTTNENGSPYPEIPPDKCTDHDRSFSYSDDIPVIYGHHWREWEPDEHLDWTARTACVDFSAVRGGPLVAYQWRGESEIDPTHYVRFPAFLA
jgi:hypothetical protein